MKTFPHFICDHHGAIGGTTRFDKSLCLTVSLNMYHVFFSLLRLILSKLVPNSWQANYGK